MLKNLFKFLKREKQSWEQKVKYPSWIYSQITSLMQLPKPYQEFFIRWYYYNHLDGPDIQYIPDTIPVEYIEDYIIKHMDGLLLFTAKGFVRARNVDKENNNLDFNNDIEFYMVYHWVAKLYFTYGVENKLFTENISKEDFIKECHILKFGGRNGLTL